MYAVVTGASSGIGREIADLLAGYHYNLIIVARREERLKELKEKLEKKYGITVIIKCMDLSVVKNCVRLYEECKSYPVRILVNNAGFGKVGSFEQIPLEEEISMIKTNVIAVHTLSKLFLKRMKKGRILNVASMAGFQPNPKMAAYGATKAYILNLSRAINYELKRSGRKVSVSTLCPGPVATEFDFIAHSDFSMHYISAKECAKAAVEGMLRKKEVIIPGMTTKFARILSKLLPGKLILPVEYYIQTGKEQK